MTTPTSSTTPGNVTSSTTTPAETASATRAPASDRASETTRVLISGANKGIGREAARQLAALGWTVWLGARDPDRGRAVAEELAAKGTDVRFVSLDVTSDESVSAAARHLEQHGGIDVLVNNAGVGGAWGLTPQDTTPADFLPVFGVNVLGPVRMIHAFLPLLWRSPHPRIVNVSSGMGSFAVTTDPQRFESTLPGLVYPASKTALNMLTSQYAKALTGIQVNAVDPGYTATDLNGHRGTQSVAEGAASTVLAATLGPGGPTGTFIGADGEIGW